jgi:O-Antigen ligase
VNSSPVDNEEPSHAPRAEAAPGNFWVVAPARSAPSRGGPFLWLLCGLLLLYAVLGRPGAHIGLPLGAGNGIYVGDLVLVFGIAYSLVKGNWVRFFKLPIATPWLLFVAWNAARTLPCIPQYGLLALRDGALWGYGLFAVLVASKLVTDPRAFAILLDRFRRFARCFVYAGVTLAAVGVFGSQLVEDTYVPAPATPMPHVAGTVAFALCGFVTVPALWWGATAMAVVLSGSQSRGALMAFLATIVVVWACNPWRLRPRLSLRSLGVFAGLGFLLLTAMTMDLNFGVSTSERVIGPSQLLQNIAGTFTGTSNESLDGTREWRMEMWNKIIDYTVFGPDFWTGRGYGINLLDDAGMQVNVDAAVRPRDPENSHLSFLARAGVPGFVLWVVLQVAWAGGMLRVLFFARRTGRRRTAGFMSFLLAYWTNFMVAACAGPGLDGPFHGIWFWTIFGVGAAATEMVRRDADFFERRGI